MTPPRCSKAPSPCAGWIRLEKLQIRICQLETRQISRVLDHDGARRVEPTVNVHELLRITLHILGTSCQSRTIPLRLQSAVHLT